MERYCITLEQAKRLKELGFKADFTLWWSLENDREVGQYYKLSEWANPEHSYPAYHVGELGEILPAKVKGHILKSYKLHDMWFLEYSDDSGSLVELASFETEAQARGALLLYLLESKLL